MGEYGAALPDMEKRAKIMKHLSLVAYRPLENELTRSYILSAITKLQCTLGFPKNEVIEKLMDDFSNSKHVDVQQRAIEYKMLAKNAGKFDTNIIMNTPMNEAAVFSQGFDFELRFLDNYVQSQVAQGKKGYDTSKRQIIGDL